jgi:hypothetical protein
MKGQPSECTSLESTYNEIVFFDPPLSKQHFLAVLEDIKVCSEKIEDGQIKIIINGHSYAAEKSLRNDYEQWKSLGNEFLYFSSPILTLLNLIKERLDRSNCKSSMLDSFLQQIKFLKEEEDNNYLEVEKFIGEIGFNRLLNASQIGYTLIVQYFLQHSTIDPTENNNAVFRSLLCQQDKTEILKQLWKHPKADPAALLKVAAREPFVSVSDSSKKFLANISEFNPFNPNRSEEHLLSAGLFGKNNNERAQKCHESQVLQEFQECQNYVVTESKKNAFDFFKVFMLNENLPSGLKLLILNFVLEVIEKNFSFPLKNPSLSS